MAKAMLSCDEIEGEGFEGGTKERRCSVGLPFVRLVRGVLLLGVLVVLSVCPFVSVTLMSDRSVCAWLARAGVLRFRICYALAFQNLIDTPKMT